MAAKTQWPRADQTRERGEGHAQGNVLWGKRGRKRKRESGGAG